MKRRIPIAIALVATMLGGCAESGHLDPPAGQKAKISQEAMKYFKESYQPDIGSIHLGAFAVSQSGRYVGYVYCPGIRCKSGTAYGQQAISRCETFGEPCYLFAIGNKIRVDYDLVD